MKKIKNNKLGISCIAKLILIDDLGNTKSFEYTKSKVCDYDNEGNAIIRKKSLAEARFFYYSAAIFLNLSALKRLSMV